MPNAKYKMQEFPTWYTCAPSHFSNFPPRMVSALETDVISRHLPKFPRIFSDPLKKVQNRKFWVCMKWKYKIWNRDIFASFFLHIFKRAVLLTWERLLAVADTRLVFFARSKTSAAFFCSPPAQNISATLRVAFMIASLNLFPPFSTHVPFQQNLSHQNYCRIQLKSWDTEKVMFESTLQRIYAEISMWKGTKLWGSFAYPAQRWGIKRE